MLIVLIVILVLALLYVLSLRGRSGHPGFKDLQGWLYAHRGLHNESRPENSMAAFRAALEAGYGVELDVHLLSDGNLAVMHDSSLKRTAGADVLLESLTTEQLKDYRLGGTDERIPTFQEVLDLFDGKAPLIVELKCANGNFAQLCQTACKMLDGYKGVYCLESFDPRCTLWLKKNRPELIRGQLSENYYLYPQIPVPWYLKLILTCQLENFLLLPDFVAYKFSDRKRLDNFIVRKIWGGPGVSWTIHSQEELDTALQEGWIGIFEGFIPKENISR